MRQERAVDNSRNEMLKGMFECNNSTVDLGAVIRSEEFKSVGDKNVSIPRGD